MLPTQAQFVPAPSCSTLPWQQTLILRGRPRNRFPIFPVSRIHMVSYLALIFSSHKRCSQRRLTIYDDDMLAFCFCFRCHVAFYLLSLQTPSSPLKSTPIATTPQHHTYYKFLGPGPWQPSTTAVEKNELKRIVYYETTPRAILRNEWQMLMERDKWPEHGKEKLGEGRRANSTNE
jgi:hypothetical protein